MSTPWERCAPEPDLPRIAACSFCPQRWLAYQSGVSTLGRPVYMCFECRAARGCCMTRADCVALLERLSLDELIALNAWTAAARGDAEYMALARRAAV